MATKKGNMYSKKTVNNARHDYSNKYREQPEIKLYLPNIFKNLVDSYGVWDFDNFVKHINYYVLLERVCLECWVNKCRIKKRCLPFTHWDIEFYCKTQWATIYMNVFQDKNNKQLEAS